MTFIYFLLPKACCAVIKDGGVEQTHICGWLDGEPINICPGRPPLLISNLLVPPPFHNGRQNSKDRVRRSTVCRARQKRGTCPQRLFGLSSFVIVNNSSSTISTTSCRSKSHLGQIVFVTEESLFNHTRRAGQAWTFTSPCKL